LLAGCPLVVTLEVCPQGLDGFRSADKKLALLLSGASEF
jgi:hypothetical protein